MSNAEENEESAIKEEIEQVKRKIESLYMLPNKHGNPVPIKKVRIYKPTVTNPIKLKKHKDISLREKKTHKEYYHVANDSNYLMAIYERKDEKGNTKRDFELINNLKAGEYYKLSVQQVLKPQDIDKLVGLIPKYKTVGNLELPLKTIIKVGTMILLWEKSPEEIQELDSYNINKRLYKIVGLSEQVIQKKYYYGTIVMRFNKESRPTSELKVMDGMFSKDEGYMPLRKMNHNQFNALIENVDFRLTATGKIVYLK